MDVPYKINSSKPSRVQFIPAGDTEDNLFISEYFMELCGFTQNQLDLMEGRGVDINHR